MFFGNAKFVCSSTHIRRRFYSFFKCNELTCLTNLEIVELIFPTEHTRRKPKLNCKTNSKICKECSKRKDVQYFYRAPGGKYGLRAECIECTFIRRRKLFLKKRRFLAKTQFATLTIDAR